MCEQMSVTIVQRPGTRGFVVCVAYGRREYPIYHGPRLAPGLAHPYFPGTVLAYADAADYSHGRPVALKS